MSTRNNDLQNIKVEDGGVLHTIFTKKPLEIIENDVNKEKPSMSSDHSDDPKTTIDSSTSPNIEKKKTIDSHWKTNEVSLDILRANY